MHKMRTSFESESCDEELRVIVHLNNPYASKGKLTSHRITLDAVIARANLARHLLDRGITQIRVGV